MKIKRVKQFTDFELSQMFNVECNPQAEQHETRVKYIDEPYVFNDIKVPLWVNRKRKVSKRVKHYCDSIKSGVTTFEPGTKGRVKDLATFYAKHSVNEVSAFEV